MKFEELVEVTNVKNKTKEIIKVQDSEILVKSSRNGQDIWATILKWECNLNKDLSSSVYSVRFR